MNPATSWWLAQLADQLSQGDLVADQAAVIASDPVTFLKSKDFKGGLPGWAPHKVAVESNGRVHLLATGSVRSALVVSHSCELDKNDGNPVRRRVLVAPAFPINSVAAEHQEKILAQKNKALMPLPDIPNVGHMYADLRSICSVPRPSVDAAQRLVSMTDDALHRLKAQLVAFFLRLEMEV